jgi:hypothetical protein
MRSDGPPLGLVLSRLKPGTIRSSNVQKHTILAQIQFAPADGPPTLTERSAQGHKDMCNFGPFRMDHGRSANPKT